MRIFLLDLILRIVGKHLFLL